MKNFNIKVFFCFVIFFVISASSNNVEAESTLIKNVTIYDGVKNEPFVGNVLIDGDKIKRVSSSNLQGDFVIDATGKILTPGMIATDTEIGIVEIGALSVTRDDSSKMYKIGFSIYDAFNPNSTLIPWNRSNGITSTLTLPQNTSSPIGGLGSYFVLDSKLQISGTKDMVMIGRVGGSSSRSRAEHFAQIEDLLILAKSLTKNDMDSDLELSDLIDDWSVSDAMNLHPRDLRALYNLVNNDLPLIMKSHRALSLIHI